MPCANSSRLHRSNKNMESNTRTNTTISNNNKTTHTPVVKPTISNWIKKTLTLTGIDTQTFTAHSTRAASKSKAKSLSRGIILSRGNWKNKSTFEKFYNKSVYTEGKQFQDGVLE